MVRTIIQRESGDLTHRVHAVETPTVWRATVAFTLNCLVTAKIACLVLVVAVTAFMAGQVAGPLDLNTIFVM